jgi:hypothetical protein
MLVVLIVVSSFGGSLPYSKKHVEKIKHVKPNDKKVFSIVKELENLSYRQLNVLGTVYEACEPYYLANTCMAISYQESKLGKYLFNNESGDYGILGINLYTYMNLTKSKLDYWGKKEVASRLIVDNGFNLAVAINNLMYWKKITNSNWKLIWGSYNAGWKPSSKYASDILNTVRALNIFFSKHKDIEAIVKGK